MANDVNSTLCALRAGYACLERPEVSFSFLLDDLAQAFANNAAQDFPYSNWTQTASEDPRTRTWPGWQLNC